MKRSEARTLWWKEHTFVWKQEYQNRNWWKVEKNPGSNPHPLWLRLQNLKLSLRFLPKLLTGCVFVCDFHLQPKKLCPTEPFLSLCFFMLLNTFSHLLILSAFCPQIFLLRKGEKEEKTNKTKQNKPTTVRYNLKQKIFLGVFLKQNLNKTFYNKI